MASLGTSNAGLSAKLRIMEDFRYPCQQGSGEVTGCAARN